MVERWTEDKVTSDAILYVRVHEGYINKKGPQIGLPNEGAFYNTPRKGPDLSSDWNKFSNPENTRGQIGLEYKSGTEIFKDPSKYYIASFLVDDLYNLDIEDKPEVEHSPRQDNYPNELVGSPWNRAHCSIIGNDEERRVKMVDIAKWEIPPELYNREDDKRTFNH